MKQFQAHALLALAVLVAPLAVAASEGTGGIPPGARISLVLDRQEFFLGENILFYYRIENTGGPAFSVGVGGDYRGGTRAGRFKITATDAQGKTVADPAPVQWNMGGLSPNSSLTNGAQWFENLWLARYCLFEEPGVYTVRVFHDLGWGPKQAEDPRELTTPITLRRPTPEQARQVVDAMFAALKYGGPTWGKKSEPEADFSVLRDQSRFLEDARRFSFQLIINVVSGSPLTVSSAMRPLKRLISLCSFFSKSAISEGMLN